MIYAITYAIADAIMTVKVRLHTAINRADFVSWWMWFNGLPIEIKDIECGLLSRVSQKIVATKWRIYKGKISSPQDILCKSKR